MRSQPNEMSPEPHTTLVPPERPSLPSLLVGIVVEPRLVSVGDTFAVTVTVDNQVTTYASELETALSFPGARVSVDAPELSPHGDEWHASRATLDGGATATFTAHVTLEDMPAGAAVLARVRVLAAEGVTVEDVVGALVVDADAGTAIDGDSGSIRTGDGQVELTFPRNFGVSLIRQVTERQTTLGDQPAPPLVAGFKRGFPTVLVTVLGSTGDGDQPFHAPGMLRHRYSREQLEALGIDEDRLTVFRYDAAEHEWGRLSTRVDTEAQTVTTEITTEGSYQLSEEFTPSEAYIPTLRDWQVSLATGTLVYQTAIDVPAGPAGIRPDLVLTYSSGATDGQSGRRSKAQASWVGKGWSLDTGSISMYKTRVFSSELTRFALVSQGVAADLIRAEPLVDRPSPSDPADWAWRSANEAFIKVRAVPAGDSTSDRGGFHFNEPYARHLWQVWTKDGMRLEFDEDLWWGWNYCEGQGNYAYMEAYRWHLSRVIDPHGNAINYTYDRKSTSRPETCFHVKGTVDVDCWPIEITWGGNLNTGEPDRYRVEFVSTPRSSDSLFNFAASQYGGINGAPRETRRLLALRIWSMPKDTWQLVRQYDFEFADLEHELFSDVRTRQSDGTYGPDRASRKLTLTGMTRKASDGVTVLPMVRFEYLGGDGGADEYAVGGWQRLSTVDNGQGGVLRLTYENIGLALDRNGLFINHHRLIARTVSSGQAGSSFARTYTWRYSYGTPSYNSLGTALSGGGIAPKPNSAELYYNRYWDPSRDNTAWLLHRPLTEFRGHDYVKEIGPDDAQIEHWFHMGALIDDASCPAGYPQDASGAPVTGAAVLEHPCFLRLRDHERLKGREYHTQVRTSDGRLVSSVQRRFEVEFLSYTDLSLVGGWRAFVYESELVESAFEGSTTPVTTATRYAYEPAKQGGSQYGNLTRVEQRDHVGVMLRSKEYFYAARDDGTTYIVDRPRQEVVRDGQEGVLALTQFFYDELDTSSGALGARGRRTRVSQYYDVRRQPSQQGITLHGLDTTYRYDPYGNVIEETTFDEPSTRLWSGGSALAIGPAGNGQTGATTHTRYDEIFHVYPCETIEPNGLTSTSDYDFHLGTVVSTIEANGNATAAEYDVFGRMAKLIRPGDTSAAPTVQMFYFDAEQPFRYVSAQRERSGQAAVRPVQRLYDGLGREIQVKSESEEGTQNIVVDKQYNGYGEIVAESQPRYVDESPDAWAPGSSFWRYTDPDDSVRWTTTRYDPAGRPLLVTQPNGSSTHHVYEVAQNSAGLRMVVDDAMDANRHRTRRGFDAFGRLVEVSELTGACGVYAGVRYDCGADQATWATSGVTAYSHDPRDLLTRVIDAAGNQTSIAYDGVGRKTAMVDPDMGSWSYEHDPSGNLVRQTDALGQVLLCEYDAVDRLTARIVETWHDAFDDGVLTGWTARGNVAESGGAATVTGTGTDWTSGLFRQAVATDRRGVTATFKVSDAANGGAVVALHSGTYGQTNYRRWGVMVVGGNLVATVWTGTTEKNTALMTVRPNSAYRATIVVDAQQAFRVTVEDLGAPGRRRTFREIHADWSGRSWGFHAQVRSGTLVLEHYQHVDELSYGYDQGTNGRGQQTSMSSPAAATAWRYDERGRIIEATHLVTALGQPRTFNWSYDSADRVTGVTYPRRADEARESVRYSYDAAGHPVKLRSETFGIWYVGSAVEGARYTALGQLQAAPMANGTTQEWVYGAPMQRLSRVTVRDPVGPLLDRSYGYDPSGNVLQIRDHRDPANDQRFAYDHLDRLSRWVLGTGTPASYTYDAIGNLLSKAGVAYDYAPRTPWAGGPHAAKTVGGQAYAYDRNGNLLSGGGRRLSWSGENLPIAVTGRDGVVETYGYDAASKRVVKHRAGAATVYVEGLWEETVGAGAKSLYGFHGGVVAVREGASLTSLHHDHLGSVAAATTAGSGLRRRATLQEFDPWGSVRSGGISATNRNYTGHPLDATGLLDAGARFYDPELARFVSADTVVPVLGGCCCSSGGLESSGRSLQARGSNGQGTPAAISAGGRGGTLLQDAVRVVLGGGGAGECGVVKVVATKQGGRALRPLTVAFSETDLLLIANAEHAKLQKDGLRFDGDRSGHLQRLASMALSDPQALNRYAYALNNPLSHVDPTGHNTELCYWAANILCAAAATGAAALVVSACTGLAAGTGGAAIPPLTPLCNLALSAVGAGLAICLQTLHAHCDSLPPDPAPAPARGGGGGGQKNLAQ